jgi:parallel beta-helix repeat protein
MTHLKRPWLLALACALPSFSHGLTLYVSPDGQTYNDGQVRTQQGTGHGPMSNIQDALTALRMAKSARNKPEADRVVLLPGRYPLTQTIKLSYQDSGTSAESPLSIEAETPGTVTLTGSVLLTGFKPVQGQGYAALQTDLPRGFHILWLDGQRGTRARSPNQGKYFAGGSTVVKPVPGDRMFKPKLPENIENTRKLVLPNAAQDELRKAMNQGSTAGLVLITMHSWNTAAQAISNFDDSTGIATVSPESFWPFFTFGPDQRFAFENLPMFLDEPGEWWLSKDGELRYWPRPDQKPAQLRAEAPQLERLLDLNGTPENPIQNVHIKGLRFAYTAAWTSPFVDSQAALNTPSAVSMSYAQQIVVEGCAFEHIGAHALAMRQGSKGNVVKASVFRDLGAGAIRIGETNVSANAADAVERNRVENNLIEDNGKSFPGAIGIWVGQSGGNVLAHNEIRRTSYSGISVGWTWGFGASKAQNNTIEYNYLHDIGLGLLSDLGAIYTLGISDGTQIRYNRIEDVRSFRKAGSSAWGVYLDEGSSHIVVENNLISRTTGGGLHLHYGQDNVVRNNVMAHSDVAQARRSKKTDSRLRFESNLLIAGDAPLFEREWSDSDVVSQNNILVTNKPADARQKQGQGPEQGSVVLSSKDVNCSTVTCTVPKADSKRTGFKPFSVQDAGIAAGTKLLP